MGLDALLVNPANRGALASWALTSPADQIQLQRQLRKAAGSTTSPIKLAQALRE